MLKRCIVPGDGVLAGEQAGSFQMEGGSWLPFTIR